MLVRRLAGSVARMKWHLGLAVIVAAGMCEAGVVHRCCTTTGCINGLPDFDYQNPNASESLHKITLSMGDDGILVPATLRDPWQLGTVPKGVITPVPLVVREQMKLFQFNPSSLVIDPCSISRIAVTLHENGIVTLSMAALQNPAFQGTPGNVVTKPGAVVPPVGPETNGLRRNLFCLRTRYYTNYPVPADPTAPLPGAPALFEVRDDFWVQRGKPYDYFKNFQVPGALQYFDQIKRVEVEFFYR
jgi:hypothetical protein